MTSASNIAHEENETLKKAIEITLRIFEERKEMNDKQTIR